MQVVVVESPAKAKTINKYLGSDFIVLASYGHVRDLPSKDGSVRPDDDFAMDYVVDEASAKRLKEIAKAAKTADKLILATDPDREGEAISWHILEALREDHGIRDIAVDRVVFNEITKSAVQHGVANPRQLDMNLVNAQQARRALDYLVGFNLSPVLWRKLPGARSAGRVQSVALRLICVREKEIAAFKPEEYWSIAGLFTTANNARMSARLTILNGEKIEKFSITNAEAAAQAKAVLEARRYSVGEIETKPHRRNPQPPFTTSTLQQEASRKLGFSATRAMKTAQRLYEGVSINGETVGLITYMRTDGVSMANEAINGARDMARQEFGANYVPEQPRAYKTKAKNAQEAHEAIRPTDFSRKPGDLNQQLDSDQQKLYDLIWKRAMASQMESARLLRTSIDIISDDNRHRLRATGTVVDFPGFLKLYEEGKNDNGAAQGGGDDDAKDDERRLPKVEKGESLGLDEIETNQHFTEPPPRYSEASLVKTLEELGIGRPSTYASILGVLLDRSYVVLDRKRFIPEDKGMLVTAFLESYFHRYVEYDFTANLENRLDEVSDGQVDWKTVLREFWRDFHAAIDQTTELRVRDVFDAVDNLLEAHLYGDAAARICPACAEGRLSLKGGRHDFFLGCSRYPDCRFTRTLNAGDQDESAEALADGPRILGNDPDSGLEIIMKRGPYGPYLQLGEPAEGDKTKPKRTSIPKDMSIDQVDFAMSQRLLALPRTVGEHPGDGKKIEAGIGRYGPFLRHDGKYSNLTNTEEVLEIGLNLAVTRLAEAAEKKGNRRGAKELADLGVHPEDGLPVKVLDGRYGPYVSHNKVNATVPNGQEPTEVTMADAIVWLVARAERIALKKGAKRKSATKKKASKKKTAKKTSGKKKSAAKKTAAKKAAAKKAGANDAATAAD